MSSMIKGRRAFLVIHGIGEQNPFETLDSFAVGLAEHFREQKVPVEMQHRLASRPQHGATWTESYVRFSPKDGDGGDYIDIHECYWANLTEDKISLSDVWNWLLKTARGTARYYRENEELCKRYEERKRACNRWIFPIYRIILAVALIYPLIVAVRLFIPRQIWTPLWDGLKQTGTAIIVGYVGDVAIYTTMDEKSKYFLIRQQILDNSESLLEALLADGQYEEVIVAGHSLGSVIAYDTLNRINIKSNMPEGQDIPIKKLAGLITFGSPLDKIAFFFREHVPAGQYVRRQILGFLHSFKSKPLDQDDDPQFKLSTVLQAKLDKMPWVNYYDCKDPVSGHLDFYQIPKQDNVLLDLREPWGVAHTGYWRSAEFYSDIAGRFIAPGE